MTSTDDTLHGACLCGAIAYHAAPPATNPGHCYCSMCQKFHGAAAGSYVEVASSGFVVERGSDVLVEYASSEEGRRGFCQVCGASLYWRSVATPGVVELALGTLNPPWTGTVDREIHVDNKPAWAPHR